MRFRLIPSSMTLDDCYIVQIFSEFRGISQIMGSTTAKRMKIEPIAIRDGVVTHWIYFSAMCRLRWHRRAFFCYRGVKQGCIWKRRYFWTKCVNISKPV